MKIPLIKILKGRFLRIAELQDLVIIELSKKFDYVLHGGTAIWRVYGSKRFSFDIDIYYSRPADIISYFNKLKILKLTRYKITSSNVAYIRVKSAEEIDIGITPFFRSLDVIERDYWLTDGTSIVVKTLSPEDLVKEKVNAYLNRMKSRDLYDIYYLLDFCDIDKIKGDLKKLLPKLETEPRDFGGLRELILLGKTPSFESIREKVVRYATD